MKQSPVTIVARVDAATRSKNTGVLVRALVDRRRASGDTGLLVSLAGNAFLRIPVTHVQQAHDDSTEVEWWDPAAQVLPRTLYAPAGYHRF